MTLRETKRSLKSNLKFLRHAGGQVRLSVNYKIVNQVLRENLQLLEREGLAACKQLRIAEKTMDHRKAEPVIAVCEDTVLNQNGSMEDALKEQLSNQNRWFTTFELSLLPDLLKTQLIHLAAVGVKSENAHILQTAVAGLHQLKDLDMETIFQQYSYTEKVFRMDPAGMYQKMDQPTRAYYRSQCAAQAMAAGIEESEFADGILKAAQTATKPRNRHIGVPLLEQSPEQRRRKRRGTMMLFCRLFLPLAAAAFLSFASGSRWLWIAAYLPFHELLRPLTERFFTLRLAPHFMPRMDFRQQIPEAYETLITVSALLPDPAHTQAMADHLEQLFLANSNGAVHVCLLADFPESHRKDDPSDSPRALAMQQAIAALNRKHNNRFCLLIRPRCKIQTQNAYAGWERKRGAILQLISYIQGEPTAFYTLEDPGNHIRNAKYVLALDQDSQLLFNAAYELVTAAAHPLNQPVIDRNAGRVVKGYGILAPVIANQIRSPSRSRFAMIFSGHGGLSVYNAFCTNHYQDLMGEGVFAGKGLMDVQAYHTCLTKAFPEERILSHDIAEGAVLRCGFVSDVEIADSNPADAIGWNKRSERWIRGDFQNLLFLLPSRVKKPFPVTGSFTLFHKLLLVDNLLRALAPVSVLALLVIAAVHRPLAFRCVFLAVSSLWIRGLLTAGSSLLKGGLASFRQQYYSRLIPRSVNGLLRCLISLITLVTDACLAFCAALKGIYRQFVSRKHLLEWTTAQELSFTPKNSLLSYCCHYFLSAAAGLAVLLCAPVNLRIFGILFVLCPFLLWWLSRPLPERKTVRLSPEDTAFLREQGHSMWRFYADTCTHEDHFLPPDNLQEQPVFAIAHRTSPTNIGLMLLSTVCAEDLGYISREEMVVRIERTYQSVQKLDRYRGHLLNWYHTRTLLPLYPRYCSTVDSGNYVCCLTAVKNRLRELSSQRAAALVLQMEKELKSTDFAPLYNDRRHLFHIGYDLENGQLSDSYYDMLMSESRMTGYFAIAHRQIPKRHWGTLGRTLTRAGRYVGPMSWTGTAFEYLMPPLLLPVMDNTLSYEAIRFCIACQRKQAAERGQPWGCSESGYWEFDDNLNYQYKPHGIHRLALKCFDRQEYIVAPYAAFLALPFVAKAAIADLKRLQSMGGCGRYGFYEALDFTRRRCPHKEPQIVRSYMAHHVGMSICALENALRNNRLHHWFMQDEMAGAKALLMETIPGGAAVYNHLTEKAVPEKPGLPLPQAAPSRPPHAVAPEFTLLGNQKITALVGSTGRTESYYNNMLLYSTSKDCLEEATGFYAFFGEKDTLTSITLAPNYEPRWERRCELGKESVRYTARSQQLTGEMRFWIPKEQAAELRQITLKNRSGHTVCGRLLVYFQPVLQGKEQFRSHPAFCRLFLQNQWDTARNRVVFEKRPRAGEAPACLAVGFAQKDSIPFSLHCNAQNVIRPEGNRFVFPRQQRQNNLACLPNPCYCWEMQVVLAPKETFRRTFVIAVGDTVQKANECFDQAIGEKPAQSPLAGSAPEGKLAEKILPFLVSTRRNHRTAYRKQAFRLQDLWKAGLSGDLPLMAANVRSMTDLPVLTPYLDAWNLLRRCGIASDFCILYEQQGDYTRPLYSSITTVLHNADLTSQLGRKGGIHVINTVTEGKAVQQAVLSACAFLVPQIWPEEKSAPPDFAPIDIRPVKGIDPMLPRELTVTHGYFSGDRFVITGRPAVPWTHMLANPSFGTQVTDRTLGFTYSENARENRLTPWSNDPVTHHTGERLLLACHGRYYDLIQGAVPVFSPTRAVYYGQVESYRYHVTVTAVGQQKRIVLQFEQGVPETARLAFYTLPTLAFDRKHAHHLRGEVQEGIPTVFQPMEAGYRGAMALNCSQPFHTCFDAVAFLNGQWDNPFLPPFDHCCMAAVTPCRSKTVFTLSYGNTAAEARKNARLNQPESMPQPHNFFTLTSDDKALDVMVNTFLPHQTVAARLYARTGFYQCSGAFGFRDQLQDAGNLVMLRPQLTKQQILLCCQRQFEEGDVLHWWHEFPAGPAGVRTRCSDDFLWLPYTIARYMGVTDDWSLLTQTLPFLSAPPLAEDCQERYDTSFGTGSAASVYEHGKRALEHARFSRRGLALIGSCDWNDGFSKVGPGGKGESVWLTQFIAMVSEAFAPIALGMGESDYAQQLYARRDACRQAVEALCWDGAYYTRAYFDNGDVIGSHTCRENRIDLLPQAFAVLAGLPDEHRSKQAVLSAYDQLVDRDLQVIRLFTPAFSQVDAGYIRSYPQGIRENGGQYTHGAVWLIQALFKIGEADKAYELIGYLNPAQRCRDPHRATVYQTEPYALAGDVYTHPDAAGRGGWTHYTGAAGWLYRILLEDMLGITVRKDHLVIRPVLPRPLYRSRCRLRFGTTEADICFELTGPCSGTYEIPLDGRFHRLKITDGE